MRSTAFWARAEAQAKMARARVAQRVGTKRGLLARVRGLAIIVNKLLLYMRMNARVVANQSL